MSESGSLPTLVLRGSAKTKRLAVLRTKLNPALVHRASVIQINYSTNQSDRSLSEQYDGWSLIRLAWSGESSSSKLKLKPD